LEGDWFETRPEVYGSSLFHSDEQCGVRLRREDPLSKRMLLANEPAG
jgi:hypothetical protein